jgi:chromosome segregation ATPase
MLIDKDGVLTINDELGNGQNISIKISKQQTKKFEVLWIRLTQLRKEFTKDLAQNTKNDRKKYEEMKTGIDDLKKADSDLYAKIDSNDRKVRELAPTVDKVKDESKVRFDSIEKKSNIEKDRLAAFMQSEDKLKKEIMGKIDSNKKIEEELISDLSKKIGEMNYKLVDLESKISEVELNTENTLQFIQSMNNAQDSKIEKINQTFTSEI